MKDYINDYPRPQFVREKWQNLNGKWNFVFDDENVGEDKKYFEKFPKGIEINIPFTYETKLSGINEQEVHYVIWYNRKINIESKNIKDKKIKLNFEGSDYITKVWINGNYIGIHRGGYSRFSFEIERYLVDGENDITIKVEDSLSKSQPRGKQRYKNESWGCHYVQTTGIWKTIWLEELSSNYIKVVKVTPDLDTKAVSFEYETNISEKQFLENEFYIETTILFGGNIINVYKEKIESSIQICNDNIIDGKINIWSPENPNLYDIRYNLYCNNKLIDTVYSYFGIRKVEVKGNKILLNNKELYLKSILDQGYYEDSHLTPPNFQAIKKDVELIKEYGFNSVRMHQKNEDERFYYYCDIKGILVWSEMANAFEYNDDSIKKFTEEWSNVVKQNYNHPSIITWVPINESWGILNVSEDKKMQNFANSMYYLTKSIDNTRPVISNDGWEHTISDIVTIHDYTQDSELLNKIYADEDMSILSNLKEYNGKHKLFASGYKYEGQPVIMSEYGGIAINSNDGWGYGKQVKDEKEFIERFEKITKSVKNIPYISGYCYTQFSDVQQEVNGLVDEKRNYKIDSNIIRSINNKNN